MKKISCVLILFTVLLLFGCKAEKGNVQYESFTKVKDLLLKKVYSDHRYTFYCGCKFDKNKKVACKTGKGKRATAIEWEHIVPASRFGQTFSSWKTYRSWGCKVPAVIRKILPIKCSKLSGRQNARRVSAEYRRMESDMYNLVPAIGYVNQKRSNYPYTVIPGEKRDFGRCDFEVENKTVEPMPGVRGNIARTYFYMNDAYPGRNIISPDEKKLFLKWAEDDPVDEWECKRGRRIERLQGNVNPFVKGVCQEKGLW
ncbi:endonuclease I [Desulfonema ishimotonii]|uniref:Endonuclease I n=1 Tax=Desulfonema ishimotonii TaxID=45657 RepID=A0A401G4G4_9BACT|nr:endonuclease [Desulfonema ishimotonii]GBC64129.1 endonuclease I [Desulfonema ishimotonii]